MRRPRHIRRTREIKAKCDPDSAFRCEQGHPACLRACSAARRRAGRAARADAIDTLARRIGRLSQRREGAVDALAEPIRDPLASAGPNRLAVAERPTLATERGHAQRRMGYGLSRMQLMLDRLSQRPLAPRGRR